MHPSIYIYIYIYMCVGVCGCGRARARVYVYVFVYVYVCVCVRDTLENKKGMIPTYFVFYLIHFNMYMIFSDIHTINTRVHDQTGVPVSPVKSLIYLTMLFYILVYNNNNLT